MNCKKNKIRQITLLLLGAMSLPILSTYAAEYVVANLGSRSFDVLLRTAEPPATAELQIFLDEDGTLPATSLRIDKQPILGSTEGDAYARRSADRQLRSAITAAGNSLFRVENASADTAYHVRLVFDENQLPEGELVRVQTLPAGEWRNTAQQMITDIDRAGAGWIGTLSISNAAAPLLSICGDSVPTEKELYFNLANFQALDGSMLEPESGTPLILRLYGKAGTPVAEKTILFSPPAVRADVAALSNELTPLLQLLVASALDGISFPPSGETFLFAGNRIECQVAESTVTSNGIQRLCYGWSGSGSVPLNGRSTEFAFTLNTDSTLNWNWRTNLWLEVVADHGNVDLSSGWYKAGSQLSGTVTPDEEWTFAGWSGSGSGSNQLTTFSLTTPSTLQALFDPVLVPGGGGMPEWWLTEIGLSGTDRNPNADLDRDGFSTKQEWIADTHPTDPDSKFEITAIEPNADIGQVRLVWQGGREASQIVEALSGNLSTTNWVAVHTNLPPTETVGECTLQVNGQKAMFFRIRAKR